MAEYNWIDGQPNVSAGVECDQNLTLEDGRTIHVRHDPLARPEHGWYAVRGRGWGQMDGKALAYNYATRDAVKAVVEADRVGHLRRKPGSAQ